MTLSPVERELARLREHWEAFRANTKKRLLVWRIPENAGRFLQAFFAVQKHATPHTTGDLFIVFDAPFENAIQYSRALKASLAGQYAATRDAEDQKADLPTWTFDPTQSADSAEAVIAALRAFGSTHRDVIGHLVMVLMPGAIGNDAAFCEWIKRSLVAGLPERMRIAAIDSIETPHLDPILDQSSDLAHLDRPPIDILGTAQETFAQEGATGSAAVFRNHLMGVVTLIEKGSAEQVKAKAVDALAFARKQHWPDQEVVVKMLVAGAMLKEKRLAESIGIYQSARTDAERAGTAGHPAGTQLVLQTWFGEAGSHLAAGDRDRAADCYDHAAALAERIPNPILAIEAFRMSAFCHAQLDQREAAKARGFQALDIGENLRPEARGMTSLPLAAMALLGVIEPERARQIEAIRHQLDRDGGNARAALEATAAGTQSAQALQIAERTLERDTAAALERAERELQALIGGGHEPFRATFARARAQLGVAWPLASPLAIMPAPRIAEGATA